MTYVLPPTLRNDFFDLNTMFKTHGFKPQKNKRKTKKILKKIKYLAIDTTVHTKTI